MFLLHGKVYIGEFLELLHGCQGPFQGSSGNVGFFSRQFSRKEPHVALSAESPGSSRVSAGKWWFLSSSDGDLRDTLVLPQEIQVSMRVARGLSRYRYRQCRGLCPHLELRLEPQGSSPGLTWISGFLWSFNMDVSPCLVRSHGSPLSFRALNLVSGFLSS